MSVREILQYPDPMLRVVCREVSPRDPRLPSLIEDLRDTLRISPGIGLSAPQIGVALRVILVDLTDRERDKRPILLINPVILSMGSPRIIREGCLSIPQYTANVERMERIEVKGRDEQWREVVVSTSGLEAVAIQHEIDHLDGVLFIDRVACLKRDLFRRKGFKGTMPIAIKK